MLYKQFKDLQLSSLGFGAMRLPAKESGYGAPIDYQRAEKLLISAYEQGINFYDTSYFYHDGDSERFLGETMARYPRDSWYLSSKLPGNLMSFSNGELKVSGKVFDSPLDVFNFQMKRCGVDYFDFFMLHNVSESTYGIYTDEKLGIIDCLLEQKAKGRIRHLGFSSHGRHGTIEKFLDYMDARYSNEIEFIMIQLNYLDWVLQEADKKYDIITKRGIPVFVMEPLRGGKLADLGVEVDGKLKKVQPENSQAAWAFRFFQSLENISVVLSGMSSLGQLNENVSIFSSHKPLTQDEAALLRQVVEMITETVPCTSCGYCVEGCPEHLDIPLLMTLYNEASYEIDWFLGQAIRALKANEKPSACTSCGNCIPLCPQNIDIPKAMTEFATIISTYTGFTS